MFNTGMSVVKGRRESVINLLFLACMTGFKQERRKQKNRCMLTLLILTSRKTGLISSIKCRLLPKIRHRLMLKCAMPLFCFCCLNQSFPCVCQSGLKHVVELRMASGSQQTQVLGLEVCTTTSSFNMNIIQYLPMWLEGKRKNRH